MRRARMQGLVAAVLLGLAACSDSTPATDSRVDGPVGDRGNDLVIDLGGDAPQSLEAGRDAPVREQAVEGPRPPDQALHDGPKPADQRPADQARLDGPRPPDQRPPDQRPPDQSVGPQPDLYKPGSFVVNRTHIALFEQIPASYLTAARNLKMLFSNRSVGGNIDLALNCLTATSFGTSPAACRRDWDPAAAPFTVTKLFTQSDYNANTVPARIRFTPDPVKYDRSNWKFEYRADGWSGLTKDFITSLAPQYITAGYQVLGYQFSYLNVDASSDIASPTTGFFVSTAASSDVHDLEAFISQHPSKVFVFWTSSLARSIGTKPATDFNAQMRLYAQQHGKILFDVADIESFTDTNAPCWDNRDGVQYCVPSSGNCENHPSDGVQYPAMCQDYTTELDGGHLGAVSGAQIRIAKAFWVLMARVAGWNP